MAWRLKTVGTALNKLKKAREGALASGNLGAFGAFGVGMGQLRDLALSTQQILEKIQESAASHQITDEQDVAGLELMEKSGAALLSAMREIKNLGPIDVIAEDDIRKMAEFQGH